MIFMIILGGLVFLDLFVNYFLSETNDRYLPVEQDRVDKGKWPWWW